MPKKTKTDEPKASEPTAPATSEKLPRSPDTDEVQAKADAELARGLIGDEVDTTPNSHYTVAGVVAGKPVPEAAKDPAAARREASAK